MLSNLLINAIIIHNMNQGNFSVQSRKKFSSKNSLLILSRDSNCR